MEDQRRTTSEVLSRECAIPNDIKANVFVSSLGGSGQEQLARSGLAGHSYQLTVTGQSQSRSGVESALFAENQALRVTSQGPTACTSAAVDGSGSGGKRDVRPRKGRPRRDLVLASWLRENRRPLRPLPSSAAQGDEAGLACDPPRGGDAHSRKCTLYVLRVGSWLLIRSS